MCTGTQTMGNPRTLGAIQFRLSCLLVNPVAELIGRLKGTAPEWVLEIWFLAWFAVVTAVAAALLLALGTQ